MYLLPSIFIAVVIFRNAGAQIQPCMLGYAVLVPCCTTSKHLTSDTSEVYCPSGCMSKNLTVWGTGIYTENTPICLAAIHAGMLSNGGGYITVQKMPGQENYSGSIMNGITSLNYGISSTSFTMSSYSTQTVASSIPLSTVTSATVTTPSTVAASTTKPVTSAIVTTPPTVAASTTKHVTSAIVTTPSTVAASTIHTTNPVTSATTTPGTSLVTSTTTYMTSTLTTQTTATTISATYIGRIDCNTYLDLLTGDPLSFLCPPNCNSSYLVWGTDIYTSNSDLCPSAIHAGVITAAGGYVTVKREPLQIIYTGSFQNGIKSMSTTSAFVMESCIFL